MSDAFAGKLQPKQLAPAVVALPNATALSCRAVENKLRSAEFHCMGRLKQLTSLDLYNKATLEAGWAFVSSSCLFPGNPCTRCWFRHCRLAYTLSA